MENVVQLQTQPTFDDFWKLCPLKRGKADAIDAWERITQPGGDTFTRKDRETGELRRTHMEATPQQLIDAMQKFRDSVTNPYGELVVESRFIIWPCRFITRGDWMDFI